MHSPFFLSFSLYVSLSLIITLPISPLTSNNYSMMFVCCSLDEKAHAAGGIRAIPFNIHTPPPPLLTNLVKIYPLKKKDQSTDTTPLPPLLSSTKKDEFFLKSVRKAAKITGCARTHQPLRNDFHSPFIAPLQAEGGGIVYKMEWP